MSHIRVVFELMWVGGGPRLVHQVKVVHVYMYFSQHCVPCHHCSIDTHLRKTGHQYSVLTSTCLTSKIAVKYDKEVNPMDIINEC